MPHSHLSLFSGTRVTPHSPFPTQHGNLQSWDWAPFHSLSQLSDLAPTPLPPYSHCLPPIRPGWGGRMPAPHCSRLKRAKPRLCPWPKRTATGDVLLGGGGLRVLRRRLLLGEADDPGDLLPRCPAHRALQVSQATLFAFPWKEDRVAVCPQHVSQHPPSPGEDALQLWCTQPAPPAGGQPAWLGAGAVPCSPGSLRAAGEPVSPVTTLSESEVCFSCDSRCRGSGTGTPSAASPCTASSNGHYRPFVPPAQGWDVPQCQGSPVPLPQWQGAP